MIALSAVCRGPDGPWGLSTLAAHPGGFERTVITRTAASDPRAFGVSAERVLRGDAASLSVDMGPDARLDVSLHDAVAWPRRAFGAIGLAHAIPWLPQYWHPVVLAAGVRGRVRAGDLALDLDGAVGYAEKNWGHGFPGRWWWGHAATFGDDDVSVSFAGGRIPLAGADVAPTAVVVRLGRRVIALAPPLDTTRVALAPGSWLLRTRGRGYDVEIAGDADGGRSARAARPRRRRAARRAAVAPASGGQPLAAGATRRAPALRRPLAARGARARPSAQRLSARRAASLSGSAPTSGSKRPITVQSALSRIDA